MGHTKTSKDTEAAAVLDSRAQDDARREKVERLRAAIADGSYSVSAEALADKMLEQLSDDEAVDLEEKLS